MDQLKPQKADIVTLSLGLLGVFFVFTLAAMIIIFSTWWLELDQLLSESRNIALAEFCSDTKRCLMQLNVAFELLISLVVILSLSLCIHVISMRRRLAALEQTAKQGEQP